MIENEMTVTPFGAHIPRFPAHNYAEKRTDEEIEVTVEVDEEPVPEGMPTETTSIFTHPSLSKARGIVRIYTDPASKSKDRSRALKDAQVFSHNSVQKQVLRGHLIALITEEQLAEKQNQAKIDAYQKILEQAPQDVEKPTTEPQIAEVNQPTLLVKPELPRRAMERMPGSIVKLVNASYEAAYPEQFGVVIPRLDVRDVLISSDKDVLDFMERNNEWEIHPLRHALNQELAEVADGNKPNMLRIWTLRSYPGNPIIYHQGDLRGLDGRLALYEPASARGIREGQITRVLIHEGLHRAGTEEEPFAVEVDDPWVELAFSSEKKQLELHGEGEFGDLFRSQMERQRDLIRERGAFIKISGTRIMLLSPDDQGEPKILTSSGYDLEEGLVDYLGDPCRQYMLDYLSSNYDIDVITGVSANYDAIIHGPMNYNFRNIYAQVPQYFSRLGLTTPEQVLVAHAEGQIPRLHRQLFPNENYLP